MYRILVLDDSTTIHKVVMIAFSGTKVEVAGCSTMVEALGAIQEQDFNLIVTDAHLAGASFPKDFLELQARAGDVPLLFLVGSYEQFDEKLFAAEGFNHFLRKPFESHDIVSKVESMLGVQLSTEEDEDAAITLEAAESPVPPPPEPVLDFSSPPIEDRPPNPKVGVELPPPPVDNFAGFSLVDLDGPRDSSEKPDGIRPLTVDEAAAQVARENRRGTKAFSDAPGDFGLGIPPPPGFTAQDKAVDRENVRTMAEALIREELTSMVRDMVESYCERHFSALAREVLTAEIRRLAEEKSRLLVDN